jgi:glycosyltransferase involved in cell wall biosynthesis
MATSEALGRPVLWIGPFPAAKNGISEYKDKIAGRLAQSIDLSSSRLHFSNWQKDYPLQFAKSMAAVVAARRRDPRTIVHIQYCPFSTGPFSIALAAQVRALGMPLVTTVHEDRWAVRFSKKRIYWRLYPFFEDKLLRMSDAIVVHSEDQMSHLPASERPKATIIEFGIERCEAISERQERARPQVGCFGLIAPYKGIDVVVQACALASERIPDLRLVIAGTVPPSMKMKRHLAQLREQVRDRLGERGQVLPDLPNDEFDALYHESDVVAFGLRHVTQSTTFFRSVAHERPVVTTDVGGVAEVTRREGLGIVVPQDDPRAMAEALMELLHSDEHRRSIARRAAAYARRRTWDQNAREHIEVYQKLAGGRGAGGALEETRRAA